MAAASGQAMIRGPYAMRSVASRHHWLVRLTHWLNIPLLVGLFVTGLSIYWASPVYQHSPDAATGNQDYVANAGIWIVRHVPGLHGYRTPSNWVYDHFSLGPYMLASALRLHWLFAYLFMFNGLLYIVGLGLGGGYKALLPRRGDFSGQIRMIRYYAGWLPARVIRRTWIHPPFRAKYNPLQRLAYLTMPLLGLLLVLTGWSIHKPTQFHALAAVFGGYDTARAWHFWLMWALVLLVIPHVILVLTDRWDTFRSMVVGWSDRADEAESVRRGPKTSGKKRKSKP